MFQSRTATGSFLIMICILFLATATARQTRRAGTFHIGKKSLPGSLDPSGMRLTPERLSSSSKVMIRLTVRPSFSDGQITDRGGTILSKRGNRYIVTCRSDAVEAIAAIEGVLRCTVSLQPQPQMDSVRAQCRINQVQGGSAAGFPHAYTGKGVITGILDTEFDTRHPAFLDSNGRTRFLAIWNQNDTSGTGTNRFGYGTIKNRSELLVDTSFGLTGEGGVHGTHTASTMAGSFSGTGYTGVAPDALIVGVNYAGNAEIAEGLIWICSIADSLNLPCVINMSIGIASGPHDGTSPIDRVIDSLSGPGRIIVGAVGNDGARYSHISFSLPADSTGKTWAMPKVDSSTLPAVSFLGADFWGEPGKSLTGSFLVMDRRTLVYRESIDSFTTNRTHVYAIDTIPWPDSSGTIDTFFLQYAVERAAESNGKPHMAVVGFTTNPHLQLGISITNPRGTARQLVHGWNTTKESFHHYNLPGFTRGDSTYTVNEIGGTAQRNITVGAYCGRTAIPQWNDTIYFHDNNEIGEIFFSSGVGPTVDGRVKPDITAPGWSIIAALSRTAPRTWDEVTVWPDTTTRLNRYGGMTGTSMASPVVAGIVALMLEALPDLTPEEAKEALQKTAITDAYTGPLSTLSNKWGAGKADALAALGTLLDIPVISRNRSDPATKKLSIRYHSGILIISGTAEAFPCKKAVCCNLLGETVFETASDRPLPLRMQVPLSSGIYIVQLVPSGTYNQRQLLRLMIP